MKWLDQHDRNTRNAVQVKRGPLRAKKRSTEYGRPSKTKATASADIQAPKPVAKTRKNQGNNKPKKVTR